MCGATSGTLQLHQMLRLPRQMSLMIDPAHTYETSFTMRGPTRVTQILRLPRKIVPQNLREICWQRMKRHLQLRGLFENDPTMNSSSRPSSVRRGYFSCFGDAFCIENYNISRSGYLPRFHQMRRLPRKVTLQHHQMLRLPGKVTLLHHQMVRLPAKMTLMIDCQLHCAEQLLTLEPHQILRLPGKMSLMILLTNETSCTMRGATALTLQPRQILRLPGKMSLMIGPARIWNVMYNAQTNKSHPNTAPATHKSNPKSKRNLLKTDETSFALRGLFENDPTMNSWSRTSSVRRGYFSASEMHFALKITTFRAPAIYPDFTECGSNITKCCACQEKWHSYITKWCACHKNDTARSPNAASARKSDAPTSRHAAPARKSDTPTSANVAPAMNNHIANVAPAKKSDTAVSLTELSLYWAVTLPELLLDGTVTLLSGYFTELVLYWALTLLICDLTELLPYWAVTWLNCYFTELLRDWTVTLLSCYLTELLLYWGVTGLNCYFPELLLYWAVAWLSCCFTELLFDWTVTILSCYRTELLLSWAVTWLNCYFTELLLYWTVTLLCACLSEFFAFLSLRDSEVSLLNFLWSYPIFVEILVFFILTTDQLVLSYLTYKWVVFIPRTS